MANNSIPNKYLGYIHFLISALISFCFIFGYNCYFFIGNILGRESIFNIIAFFGIFFLCKYSFSLNAEKRVFIYSFLFSFMLSVSLLLGHTLYLFGDFSEIIGSTRNFFKTFITFIGFNGVIHATFLFVHQSVILKQGKTPKTLWRIWNHPTLLSIPIFLSWLPCYLSYYPGIFSYDMYDQTPQALGVIALTKYHPPLHTLLWKLCLIIEQYLSLNALVIYSLFQMSVLALAFAYILKFMVKRHFSNSILLVTLLFFCFNPVIAIFSFVPAKDVLFTAAFSSFTIALFQFTKTSEEPAKKIIFSWQLILFGTLSCLLRNNAFYALLVAFVVIFAILRKQHKKILLNATFILMGYILINGPLFSAIDIGAGNSREMLSVPIQQISYVVAYHETELSPVERNAITNYLPIEDLKSLYNPRLADPIKITFKTQAFEENPMDFIKLWFKLLIKYPEDYIIAFLNLNLPYWYPDACTIDSYANRAYIETYIYDSSTTGYEVIRESKFPWLYTFYEKVASYDLFKTLPVISNLFSISTPIWSMVVTIFILIIKNKKELWAPIMPAFFLWCTYLLGPVSNFRYMFPIIVFYPLFFAMILQCNSHK